MSLKNSQPIERLTVLWAITECGLGGFFHAIQSPFTGLLVGGLSVIYISLIAWHALKSTGRATVAKSIFQAAVTVLIAKAVISPHSPVGAYVAVSLQASLGILFFSILPSFKLSAILLGTLASTASAAQKILILWIVFGTPFFEAFDAFVLSISEKLTDSAFAFSASNLTAIAFISIYTLGGLAIGILITQIPSLLNKHLKELSSIVGEFEQSHQNRSQRNSKRWTTILMLFLFVIAFAFQYFFISSDAALSQLIRTLTIVGLWFILVQPLIKWAIRSIAKKKQSQSKNQLELIQSEIPVYLSFSKFAWQNATRMKSNRLLTFVLLLLHFTLHER